MKELLEDCWYLGVWGGGGYNAIFPYTKTSKSCGPGKVLEFALTKRNIPETSTEYFKFWKKKYICL